MFITSLNGTTTVLRVKILKTQKLDTATPFHYAQIF